MQNKQKGRIVIILNMHLFAVMAVYFILFSVCMLKHERVRTYVLISQFSTKISVVDFWLFFKNFFKNSFGCWHIFTWLLKLKILDVYMRPWLLRDNSDGCWWNSDRTYIYVLGCLDACKVVARSVQQGHIYIYTNLARNGLKLKYCKHNWEQ